LYNKLQSNEEVTGCEEEDDGKEVDYSNVGKEVKIDGPFYLTYLCRLILILFRFGLFRLEL
jgi:hypothetical protein